MVKKAKKRLTTAVRNVTFFKWFAARKTWQKWFFASAGVVSLLAIGSGIVMYVSWHQNAERIVAESLFKAATAPSTGIDGSFKAMSPTSTTTVSLKSLGTATDGQLSAILTMGVPSAQDNASFVVKGNAAYVGDTLYFKVDDTEKLYTMILERSLLSITEATAAQAGKSVDAVRAEIRQQFQTLVRPIVDRLADKWIVVAPEDITGGASDLKRGLDCMKSIAQRISDNDAAVREVRQLYERHQFLAVKHRLNDDKDTIGYAVTLKSRQLQDFGTAIEQTQAFTKSASCKQVSERTKQAAAQRSNDAAGADSGVIELRMQKESHQLTTISYKDEKDQNGAKTSTTLTAALTFGQPVKVQAPQYTIPFSEVKAAFDDLAVKTKALQQ